MADCPKCYAEGKRDQKMEPHHCSCHWHCPKHGWLATSDVTEYWGAINEFESRSSRPAGATALQIARPESKS